MARLSKNVPRWKPIFRNIFTFLCKFFRGCSLYYACSLTKIDKTVENFIEKHCVWLLKNFSFRPGTFLPHRVYRKWYPHQAGNTNIYTNNNTQFTLFNNNITVTLFNKYVKQWTHSSCKPHKTCQFATSSRFTRVQSQREHKVLRTARRYRMMLNVKC